MNTFFKYMIGGFIILHLVLLKNAIAMDIIAFTNNYQFSKNIKSVKELRNEKLIRQQYDFNCAASSLATLLNYQYGENYTEIGLTNALITSVKPHQRAAIKENGFTLAQIKKVSHALGYKTASFTVDTLEELRSFNFPSIARIELKGIPHFVVVKRIENGHVFLADPAWGNRSMTYHQFTKIWQRRYAFFVLPKDKKLGDKTLVNAFSTKTPVTESALYTEQISPNVWFQQDIDKFIVNTTPFTLSK